MTVDAAQTFNFLPIPTDVHFGYGSARSVPDHVRGIGGRKVFVVTDPGVRAAGIVDRVTAGLEQAAIRVRGLRQCHGGLGVGAHF